MYSAGQAWKATCNSAENRILESPMPVIAEDGPLETVTPATLEPVAGDKTPDKLRIARAN